MPLWALSAALVLALSIVSGFGPVGTVSAQEITHDHANVSKTGQGPQGTLVERSEVESERLYMRLKGFYMSPYCPGLTLGSCGSGAADLLRTDLRSWVVEGHTEEDITTYMIATFGDEVLGAPAFKGGAIVVWVAPILALLLGLILLVAFLKRNSAPAAPASAAEPAAAPVAEEFKLSDALDQRLEAEVQARTR
jgi:cytochrome c-type biogenesis protein CcmH